MLGNRWYSTGTNTVYRNTVPVGGVFAVTIIMLDHGGTMKRLTLLLLWYELLCGLVRTYTV